MSWQCRIHLQLPKQIIDFPGGSDGKASVYYVGDPGSIPGWGRSPGEGNGNPLQYSCLENPMDGGAWQATVHGVEKSQTRLSDFTSQIDNKGFASGSAVKNLPTMQEMQDQSLGWEDPLEEGMATHSSVLVQRIPRTEEPCGLQSFGSQRVRHD